MSDDWSGIPIWRPSAGDKFYFDIVRRDKGLFFCNECHEDVKNSKMSQRKNICEDCLPKVEKREKEEEESHRRWIEREEREKREEEERRESAERRHEEEERSYKRNCSKCGAKFDIRYSHLSLDKCSNCAYK